MPNTTAPLAGLLQPRYAIQRQIGRGGMATVYLATDVKHNRPVAIKIIEEHVTARLGNERFLREIRLAATLNHPHVLPLLDSGEAGGTLYYVMPFISESLRHTLRREGTLDINTAVRIAMQVASGLEYAHNHGVIHRDVKPDNILLHEGEALLADFGVASLMASTDDTRITRDGAFLGTPEYMSPDSATEGYTVDHHADIYSLGCVLFEMLVGHPPFTGDAPQIVIAKSLLEPIPYVRFSRAEVPEYVDQVIRKALAKNRIDRFASASDLASALRDQFPVAFETDTKSIVVLPFDNLSANAEDEYVSDGLTDEIITDLSNLEAVRVISRNSAMQLKRSQKDTRTIGKELNVQYVAHGSVRRSGNDLRISAQLVDAIADSQLWARKYAGTVGQVFELQETLSRDIVDALKVRLSASEQSRLRDRPIPNAKAYDCYLRARQEIYRFTADSFARAQHLAEQATSLVGDNELIYSVMGQAYLLHLLWGVTDDPSYLLRTEECAARIASLNGNSPRVAALRGMVAFLRGDRVEAARLLNAALRVSPDDPDTLIWLVSLYVRAGKLAPIRPLTRRLLEIDPLTPIVHSWAGWMAWLDQGPGPALLEANRKTYEMDPRSPYGGFLYAWALVMCGNVDLAVPLLNNLEREAPDHGCGRIARFLRLAVGQVANATAAVTPELTSWAGRDDLASWWMADCYALVGATDEALAWLENAVNRGLLNYPGLDRLDPLLATVRADPRFKKLTTGIYETWRVLQ